MKILVTGGTGFIGHHIVNALLKDGHKVSITASSTENKIPDGVEKVLYPSFEGINWKHVSGLDAVVHQAANNDTLSNNESEMYRANVFAPIKLFQVAIKGGCKKFVYASSTAVYGNQATPFCEKTLVKPLNVYGETKAAFDKFAMEFANEKGVSVIGLRYCNVYGPGENHKGKRASMVYQIIKQVLNNEEITLYRDGTQKRDWIYVKDVVGANLAALNTDISGIFNCATGKASSFMDLVKIITNKLTFEKDLVVRFVDNPCEESYQNNTECSIEKMRKELNFSPHFDIKSGIEDYLKELAVL